MGDVNSIHDKAMQCKLDLLNQPHHIPQPFEKQSAQHREDNRLRLKVSIDAAKYLTLQGLTFRGHDEKEESLNRGNFLELIELLASYDKKVETVMKHRYGNVFYTSGQIQKEIIQIIARKVLEKLRYIINSATRSTKRNDELLDAQAEEISQMIENNELETGRGLNQVCKLQRAGDTRWGSYLRSVSRLIEMFNSTRIVLDGIIDDGTTTTQRGQAFLSHETMNSFDFIFILHFIKELMEITDFLSQALQKKSQDIANVMYLVRKTKTLVQKLRDEGWDDLLLKVKSFCATHDIQILNLSEKYKGRRGRSRVNLDEFSIEDHYRVDVFYATIDFQLQELNSRFNEQFMDLISLSCALDPKDKYSSFDVEKILELAKRYYSGDFTEQEVNQFLPIELRHFGIEVSTNENLNSLPSITKLCQWMVESGKSKIYPLIFKLVSLVLTLPVSTATSERAFSAMQIVKTRLRNKMCDDYLTNALLLYIEREIVDNFSIDALIDDFRDSKERKLLLELNQ